jgi:predicted kinase
MDLTITEEQHDITVEKLCRSFIIKRKPAEVTTMNANKETGEIVLIRGLPGSGKSTMAAKMNGYLHLEADMFLEINGIYVYDASKVKAAHERCIASARKALEQNKNVVVSNTFVKIWELQRYIDLGLPFKIIEL